MGTIKTMRSAEQALVACVLVLGLAACHRTEPIYNVENRMVPAQSTASPSSGTIGDAIIRAAVADNWHLDVIGPGQYRATTTWRGHSATALISYDNNARTYSIVLDQSQNLKQANGQIHRAYNRRVQQLEAEIDRQMLLPAR